MKAILESIECDWEIQRPYVTWSEDHRQGFEMRGKEFPKGKDIIPIRRELGKASVRFDIKFSISGNPQGKENDLIGKIHKLLNEIEV
ncbi:MAG: hypothetical protein JKY53_14670 [Flavobacteriales bacterium]|nr:hypothetical protein [Flavobacteriales bacterium]